MRSRLSRLGHSAVPTFYWCRMVEFWRYLRFLSKTHVLIRVAICWSVFQACHCQICPPKSRPSFEKVAGVSLRGARLTPLYRGGPGDISLVTECLTRCRSQQDCSSVLLSYAAQNCMKSSSTSEQRRSDLSPTQPPSATTYFEKICLDVSEDDPRPFCEGRLWAFERSVGFELSGFDDRTVAGVSSRLACEELCLREAGFRCRSGEFDYAFQQCRLSSEDRRSQPASFRPAFGDVDYFENQCLREDAGSGCEYEETPDTDLERPDAVLTAASASDCRRQCDAVRDFLCRAFSYRTGGACLLSSDDTFNLAPDAAIRRRAGTSYFQRSNCLDLKLQCTDSAMQLVLRTREPFDGRLYAQAEPHTCQVFGQKSTLTRFVMDVKGQCGVQIEGDHLTSTVVIQYHPLIQQKGDRIIKLYCSLFDETNRTVSKSFSVVQGPEPGATAVVNATAPTPNIRLRIVDANGTDVTGTRIGEPLYFRIEIDNDSVFGIFARDMTARNGRGDVQINLIDSEGCALHPRIFPPFTRIAGTKSLQSRFQAFKFSEDPVVRFQVNVHFCLEECSPAQCAGAGGWGRRRRRRQGGTEMPLLPDYPLVAAIVVEGAQFGNESQEPKDSQYIDMRGDPDELVCTTKTVVVVSSLGALFLQIGLLAACATCLLLARKEHRPRYSEDAASTITATLPPFGAPHSPPHTRLR